MKLRHLAAALLLLPPCAFAATVTGTLKAGGGADNISVVVKLAGGKELIAYCVGHCGDIFVDSNDPDEGLDLKKHVIGKKIILTYKEENNRGRMAGPGEDEILPFVQKLEFAR